MGQELPFEINENLFDQNDAEKLGLSPAKDIQTVTIYQPDSTNNKFSNGAVMIAFKDKLFCQWQSSAKDEDAPDSKVVYSGSIDGMNWSAPKVLAESIPQGYCSSGGWWLYQDTLIAYINVWPDYIQPRGGYTAYKTSVDGMEWSEMKAVRMMNGDTLRGIFEQDPHALSNGRIINAAHFQPGLQVNPIYTDDPSGRRGWVKSNFQNLTNDKVSRCIEPSTFTNMEGDVIMSFRDQKSTFYRFAAISKDHGENWSMPVETNMPDARNKQSAGNLPDGTAYLVGSPVNQSKRFPLVVTLSKTGKYFDKAYLLRAGKSDMQPLRYEGKAKKAGYHYPKSMIYKDILYISYTTNKEDVEYTMVPIKYLTP